MRLLLHFIDRNVTYLEYDCFVIAIFDDACATVILLRLYLSVVYPLHC